MSTEVQKQIMNGLAPFDKVDQQVVSLQEEYRDLKINGPDDRDGYEIVKNAWRHLREVRLGAEKLHRELKADALAYSKACDARLRQIKDGLTPMEDDFHAQWKAEDTRKEREAEEARVREAAERAAKWEARKKELFALGMTWNGQTYASRYPGIDEVSEAMVKEASDEVWSAKVEAITAKTDNARSAERKAKEEADRKAEELRAQEAALNAQREEQERKARELEAKQRELEAGTNEARLNELRAIGAVQGTDYRTCNSELHTVENWPGAIEAVKASVAARKERERIEADERAKADAERMARERKEQEAREKAIAEDAARKERERIEAERLAKQEAEQERMAKLGDAERFAAVADALRQARSAIAQIAQGVQSKEGRMWMEEMQDRVAQEIRRVENGALALSKARQVEPA